MFWSRSQTDLDARDAQLISEQLRHERLFEQGLKVNLLESTPLNEPAPRLSMAQHREDQLQQQARSILDVMGDDDQIPM